MKSYIIIDMFEKDFGCEGLPEGQEMETEVSLRTVDGEILEVTIPDAELVSKDINEGDWVHFTSAGEIVKE